MAYNELSAVAHGTIYGMVSRMEEVARVPAMEGVALASPSVNMSSLLAGTGVALLSYQRATDRRFDLYGWHATYWKAWKVESAKILVPLLRK